MTGVCTPGLDIRWGSMAFNFLRFLARTCPERFPVGGGFRAVMEDGRLEG